MNIETVSRIEQEIIRIEKDRTKAVTANDAAIELEENRKSGHTDIQAANVEQLKAKRDSVILAYDKLRERKAVELATARAEVAAMQARQNAELETQAAKLKANALRAYLAAGGLPAEFDEHYKGIVTARTVEKMGEEKKRFALPIPRI